MKRKKIIILFTLILFGIILASGLAMDNTVMADEVKKFEDGIINYDNGAPTIFPYEPDGGIYILNGGVLNFYNIDTGITSLVYDFGNVKDSYVANNKIYLLKRVSYEEMTVSVYDIKNKCIEKNISVLSSASVVGADNKGRIYVAGYDSDGKYIKLLTSEGVELSVIRSEYNIYDFAGFDSTNGNFYIVGYANWVYWGYDHAMNVLRVGNVKDNKLSLNENYIEIICQQYFYEREKQVELIGNKYVCIDNTFYSQLQIFNSNTHSMNKEEADYIIKNDRRSDDAAFDGMAAVGTRTVYLAEKNSIITYKDNMSIAEYDLATGEEKAYAETTYPVYVLMKYKDGVVAIERNNDEYYCEYFGWKEATYLKITGNSQNIKVGKTLKLNVLTDATLKEKFQWKSSNSKVASVNQLGEVCAWKKGNAVITVTNNKGLKASYKINVVENSAIKTPKATMIKLKGKKTNNISANDYNTYGRVVNSYLFQDSDGKLNRVEYTGKELIAEKYTADCKKLLSSKKIKMELNIFGGFFAGKDNYYVVFGQKNLKQSDSREVIRVVKYSKDFCRISSVSVKGANTYIPFDAGSLRMTETNGKLYIHTCHEMYASGDELHHQANMTFVIDQKDMKVSQSFSDVLNISQAGYVSHSFNQFIKTDGKYVYRVDHGDAYPRAIALIRSNVDGEITDVRYTLPISLEDATGYFGNATGASVGGFELSDEECIVVGNAVDYSKKGAAYSDVRNIFVTITTKDLKENKIVWLTNYNNKSSIRVKTPNITKINANNFIVMWEEYNNKTGQTFTKMATINNMGDITSNIVKTDKCLSDCQPVLCKDGLIRWYVSDGKSVKMQLVNPFDLNSIKFTAPAKVKGLKQAKNRYSTSIKMTWKKVEGVQGYEVYRATSKKGKYKKVTTTKKASYKNNKLKAGKKYFYKVRAYKTVNGIKVYGSFSSVVKMNTKAKK